MKGLNTQLDIPHDDHKLKDLKIFNKIQKPNIQNIIRIHQDSVGFRIWSLPNTIAYVSEQI